MVNISVIGAGRWGRNHIRLLNELPGVNLIKICDSEQKTLDESKRLYKIDMTCDFKDVLYDSIIDAVNICTPLSSHYKIAKACLEYGKHVFIEKPMTVSSKEAAELIDLAENKQKILMVGHIFRFDPGINRLKEEMVNGRLGRIRFVYTSRVGLMTPREDCDVISDLASHDFDILSYLLNKQPQEVTAVASSFVSKPYDVGFINLKFDDVLANIIVSWLCPTKVREVWVVGEKGSAKMDSLTQKLEFYDKTIIPDADSFGAFKLLTKEGGVYSPYIKNDEPLKLELEEFISCIEEGRNPRTDGKVGYEVVKVIEAAKKSIIKKRAITLK